MQNIIPMKIYCFRNLLFVLISFSNLSFAQEIVYGSNNGNYLKVFNHQIYYEEYGEGPPLLLLHWGSGSISTSFNKLIPKLENKFRLIAIDSPGHGRSEQTDSLSHQLLADYFNEIINILKLDSVNIMGISDGGIAALILAADRPDVVKRVIASGAQFIGPDALIDDYLPTITPEKVEKDWDSGLWDDNYMKMAFKGNDWRKLIIDLRQLWNQEICIPNKKVEKIGSKVMIVFGDHDIVKLEHGLEMHKAIKGSELLILPNTGHDTFGERSELIAEIAVEFFTK